jgi:hypothetical protein
VYHYRVLSIERDASEAMRYCNKNTSVERVKVRGKHEQRKKGQIQTSQASSRGRKKRTASEWVVYDAKKGASIIDKIQQTKAQRA